MNTRGKLFACRAYSAAILTFGKHNGKSINTLESGYLEWMQRTLDNHWGALAKQVLETRQKKYVLEFGKHAGKTLDEVPDGYLQWMARELKDKEAGILAKKFIEDKDPTPQIFTKPPISAHDDFVSVEDCIRQLKTCWKDLGHARDLQHRVFKSELFVQSQVYLSNLMILMFGRCLGGIDDARALFQSMKVKNEFTWNTMLKVFLDNHCWEEAESTFSNMHGLANLISCTAMVSMYSSQGRVADAKQAFDRILNTHKPDAAAWNSLMVCYAKNGCFEEALDTFERMRGMRNAISWNALLSASTLNYKDWIQAKAKAAFNLMPQLDIQTCTTMILAHANSAQVDEFRRVFRAMEHRDVITWSVMISAYAQSRYVQEAEEILQRMPMIEVLSWNNILACYAKNARMEDALIMFEKLPKVLVECWDAKMWNTLMAGYAVDGKVMRALELFHSMNLEGISPDEASFLCILNGYSHIGTKVEDGRRCFISMFCDYQVEANQKHYTCMVDMLGRAGHLGDAEDLVNNMPFVPNTIVWLALLAACRNHKDEERARRAGKNALQLEPCRASAYVMMANTSNKEEGELVKIMKKKGIKRMPGISTVKVGDKVHRFVVGDKSHPRAAEIYKELDRLSFLMKEAGYVPNTSVTLLPGAEQKEKEELLCRHSEKLALAFALISTERGTNIEITKNLRMCYDCHDATRFISKIVGRSIMVKDANRIHRFENNVCSCGEIW